MQDLNLRCKQVDVLANRGLIKITGNSRHRQISNTSRTKSQTLNVSRLALQLSLPIQLKSGIQARIKL